MIRSRRQRLAKGAIIAAKEVSVKLYVVRLSGEERERLETLIRKGKSPCCKSHLCPERTHHR